MKVALLAFLVLSIGFLACEKDDEYTAQLIQQEIDDREDYLEKSGIPVDTNRASGLYYFETKTGAGIQPVTGDKVKVHYIGQFLNGTIFDSSYDRDKPIEFTLGLGEVIPGWDEAIALMKEGGTADLIIPSNLAYGATGYGSIPPYTTLIFNVELINDAEVQETKEREAYLEAENITVEPTESGLYYIETEEGIGVQAATGDVVQVHYEGRFLNGQVFDSSWERGTPIEFTLGESQVIKGFEKGIALMKEGGKARLIIPSNLAYGSFGSGIIPSYTTTVFDVELVEINNK